MSDLNNNVDENLTKQPLTFDSNINKEADNCNDIPITLLNKITELSKAGYNFLKLDNIEAAEFEFNKILELDPANNYALVGLGDTARRKNNFQEAAEYYKKCLESHPKNNYALFGLADAYKTMKQYQKAIDIWNQYLQADENNVTVLTRVADAYRKMHDFDNAKTMYTKTLEIAPDNLYALIGLGHLNYDFKRYRESLVYWEKILQLHEKDIDIRILTSIGNCYRKMKIFDKGVYYFEKALGLEDNNFYGLFGLADCYRGLNLQSKSIKYWQKILVLDPGNKVILTRLGDAYRNMEDYGKAEDCYRRALDINFDTYAMFGLAVLLEKQGKYEEAILILDDLRKTDASNYRGILELASCYLKIGKKHDAIKILTEFQNSGIKNQNITDFLLQLTESEN